MEGLQPYKPAAKRKKKMNKKKEARRGQGVEAEAGGRKTSYADMAWREVPPVHPERKRQAKPPAVLIHILEGSDYTDTVTKIKVVVDFSELKGEVRKIRRTK